jgi:hypothetical protein
MTIEQLQELFPDLTPLHARLLLEIGCTKGA